MLCPRAISPKTNPLNQLNSTAKSVFIYPCVSVYAFVFVRKTKNYFVEFSWSSGSYFEDEKLHVKKTKLVRKLCLVFMFGRFVIN